MGLDKSLLFGKAMQKFAVFCTGLFLLVLPFLVNQKWLLQPFIIWTTGLIATQVSVRFGKEVFGMLERHYDRGKEAKTDAVGEELRAEILSRTKPISHEAANAIDSYLGQAIGMWGSVVLVIGYVILILFRAKVLKYEYPEWVLLSTVGALVAVVWLMLYLFTTGRLGGSIGPYYGRDSIFPPNTFLTWCRVFMLGIYLFLAVESQWPSPGVQGVSRGEKQMSRPESQGK